MIEAYIKAEKKEIETKESQLAELARYQKIEDSNRQYQDRVNYLRKSLAIAKQAYIDDKRNQPSEDLLEKKPKRHQAMRIELAYNPAIISILERDLQYHRFDRIEKHTETAILNMQNAKNQSINRAIVYRQIKNIRTHAREIKDELKLA